MTAFDKECPRCHGKGIQDTVTPQAIPAQSSYAAASNNAPPPQISPEKAKSCCLGGCGLLFFFTVVLPLSCAIIFPTENKFNDAGAYYAAKQSIERQLASPSTAVFPGPLGDYRVVKTGENTATVYSHVDAQNAFGAVLRKKWIAKVRWYKANDVYSVEESEILE